jgi:hypothetical protein
MKLNQNVRHFAAKKALTLPIVGDLVNNKLVDLHTNVFLGKADEAHRESRREHLDGFFDATMDTYVAALEAGYTEAEAREITHVQANFDFFNHGWTEMMEFPADELETHYERHREFFEPYGITIADPLGSFAPPGGVPEASSTPEKLENPVHPHAEGGFADDVYVSGPDGELLVGGHDEPEDVNLASAPGVSSEDAKGVDGTEEAESD